MAGTTMAPLPTPIMPKMKPVRIPPPSKATTSRQPVAGGEQAEAGEIGSPATGEECRSKESEGPSELPSGRARA